MLKIGDLSKLSQVSVKTLRYYDEVGLLNRPQVDRFTDYRYYSIEQIPRLNRILAFKDLGFSLEQIARLLDENLPPAPRSPSTMTRSTASRMSISRQPRR